jgi:bifunctional oligoribonuclease and PAP phosphatase NrnA
MESILTVPATRRPALEEIASALRSAERIVLTTHVNADGDGAGSEVAIASWLASLDKHVRLVNPTPYPEMFRFLLDDPSWIADATGAAADVALREADVLVILDTAEPARIGRLARMIAGRPVIVIDHHIESNAAFTGAILQDVNACATGELVYDLLLVAGLQRPWADAVLNGIYTAIVTDTGSFRFSNTTRRAHAIAGDLLEQGVDPEAMYRRIYATVPLRRITLLRHALERLEVDPEYPITWITIERGAMDRLGATSDDLEGVVEHARSVEGTEVAILFRETADGSTKVSLRSAGDANVNAVARQFGGGGHIKASGALIPEPLAQVRPRVLEATRAELRAAGMDFRAPREPV